MAALGPGSAQAFTSFLLEGNDGDRAYGRTMEFGLHLQSAATLIQRGTRLQDVSPNGIPGSGLKLKTQYAAVGMNALGQPVLVDELNEKGLAGGLLNAPNSAIHLLLTHVLSTSATVEEVKTKLPKILVNQSALGSYRGVARIQMTASDRSGNSLALEYLNDQLVMRDNSTGVFTNDPPFEQHYATLGNYVNLVPNEAAPHKIGGTSFGAISIGGGMAGLLGEMLSTSRFVRAVLLSRYAQTNVSTAQQVA
jgi:choloylglycine hydrolase